MAQYVVRRKSDGLYLSDELNINVVCEGQELFIKNLIKTNNFYHFFYLT